MLPYFTVDEICSKSGLKQDQVLRLGMSGQLVFSVLEHAATNYEEINEAKDEEGRNIRHTKTNEIMAFGNAEKGLKLRYVATEDLINIVVNDAPNRKTLVRAVYETRDLDQKTGKWFVNNPMRVALSDLVISAPEWECFEREKGKSMKAYVPLNIPEKVTLHWLWKNVSFALWVKIVVIAAAIFSAGLFVGQSAFYENAAKIFSSPPESQ